MTQRELDLELLRDLWRYGHEVGVDGDSGLSSEAHDAFGDMLRRLSDSYCELTPKQRAFALEAAERLGLGVRRDNSRIPVGRPVEVPEVLKRLPLKPPGRRSA